MKNLFAFLVLVLFSFCAIAQEMVPNEILVHTSKPLLEIINNSNYLRSSENFDIDQLSMDEYYYLYTIDKNSDLQKSIDELKQNPYVTHVSRNYKVKNRVSPNDPFYSELSHLDLINIEDAWDISTGGFTSDNKEIVLAIIDDGFDINHVDMIDNIWTNEGEIPNDGIDNDGNGYIDDYYGLNNRMDNDDHPILSHGTSVAGLAGARGDNGIGVTGINWNVKLMIISSGGTNADIIECYEYIRAQRKKYNETNGAEGAFIVATNASWGFDNFWAEDFPVWCGLYDSLGEEGILSVAATSNSLVDVSIVGDMPSTCESKYLIVATNVDQNLNVLGAFSQSMVDLAAPGDLAYSTKPGDSYSPANGTSSAAPMITGAIGLLYSVNASLILNNSDPGVLACSIKDAILNSVRKETQLEGITVTGGVLDMAAAVNELINCELNIDGDELSICSISPNPTSDFINFEYVTPPNSSFDVLIHNDLGKLVYAATESNGSEPNGTISIELKNYSKGVYFLTILNEEIKSSLKFVKTTQF